MGLIRLAALGALGYAGYRYFMQSQERDGVAFASGQGDSENFARIRDAGPHAMSDTRRREWTATDEASDQSFPASDPPSTY